MKLEYAKQRRRTNKNAGNECFGIRNAIEVEFQCEKVISQVCERTFMDYIILYMTFRAQI